MNLLHMKYAVEVARVGSLNKASETLFVALPNISRSIKELEADIGITVFERSAKGVTLTPEGEEFIGYANSILKQLEDIEELYKNRRTSKQRFTISVPRACYIADAFAEFSRTLDGEVEIFYKETNSQKALHNILEHDYKLGIIRYAEGYDEYFKNALDDKGLSYEVITEFSYNLIMSRESRLADATDIGFADLDDLIEISHADPYVPSLPLTRVMKEELSDNIKRRIFVFERASQLELLSRNPETFMWVSPAPEQLLERYGLVQKKCRENRKVYKDVLVYRKGYKFTRLDRDFITALCESKRRLTLTT